MLFIEYGEDGCECVRKEFVDGVVEVYGSVIWDNYGIVLFMEEYGDAMLPFARYCFLVVAL